MRVRMLFSASGMIDGHVRPQLGEEIEVNPAIGEALCRKAQAEPVAVKTETRAEKRPAKKTAAEKRA